MNLDPCGRLHVLVHRSRTTRPPAGRTQIASFAFDACGCELEPSAAERHRRPGDGQQRASRSSWQRLRAAERGRVPRSAARRTPGGPYEVIGVVADSSPGVGNGPLGYTFLDTDVSGRHRPTTTSCIAFGRRGLHLGQLERGQRPQAVRSVHARAADFAGLRVRQHDRSLATCTLDVWRGVPRPRLCPGGSITYDIHRSTDAGRSRPDASNLLVGDVPSHDLQRPRAR